MSKCIAAHTNPGASYPGFINLTREDNGSVIVHFRGDPQQDGREGATASLRLTAADFAAFVAEATNGCPDEQSYADLRASGGIFADEACPGHVASDDPRVCGRCGIHIDGFRPDGAE